MTLPTIIFPGDLADALTSALILPGSRILLREGVYSGDFICTLVGGVANIITIQSYPGERAIIDGSLTMSGVYTDLVDLEITYSGWEGRDAIADGVDPAHALVLSGTNNRAIGCVVHDTSGNYSWQTNVGGGFLECLIYNCGWMSGGAGFGHAIYTQNELATQTHSNNILWGQYNYGMHGYTLAGLINNFSLLQNTCFRNGGRQFALGGLGGQRAHNCTVDQNVMLEGDGWLKGDDITLTNNYSPNGFTIDPESQNVTQSGNTFTAPKSGVNSFVFPRANKAGWAHVAVFNWESADSVSLDLSGITGLSVGDAYKLHNAQDYFTDIVTGTVPENQTIAVDMRSINHTVAARIGSTAVETTFPTFGAFVVEKV